MTEITDAINVLRKCAWKGNRRGLQGAMDTLTADDVFNTLAEAWGDLEDAHNVWSDGGDRDDAETLDEAIDVFDAACERIFGKTEWAVKAERGIGA